MASVPSFDPNSFIPSIKVKDWAQLTSDEANPLINRAVSAFPPGSTFKIVTALAGLRKGLANARFTCTGGVTYGDHYFQCWIRKGGRLHPLGQEAIKVSCNAFFYHTATPPHRCDLTHRGGGVRLANPGRNHRGEKRGCCGRTGRIPALTKRVIGIHRKRVTIGQGYDLATRCKCGPTRPWQRGFLLPRMVGRVLNQRFPVVVPKAVRVRRREVHADFRRV